MGQTIFASGAVVAEPPVKLRQVALPSEHGGWGLLAEPLVLGLAVEPTVPGTMVAVAAVAAFLARHPLRLALLDLRRGTCHARTRAALMVAGICLLVSGLAAFGAIALERASVWPCALAAAPFAIIYLAYDLRFRGREPIAELAGAVALSATAPLVALAGGWDVRYAVGLWILVGGRACSSVVEVRSRLRRSRAPNVSAWPSVALHLAVSAAAIFAAQRGIVPAGATIVPVFLLIRGVRNLAWTDRAIAPRLVGWSEVRAGAASVVAWIAAYALTGPR